MLDLPPLKPHQVRGIAAINAARREKCGPILGVAPTGAGKSRVMFELAKAEAEAGGRVVIMAHRKMLLDQLVHNFTSAGLEVGVIAPDYPKDSLAAVQIVSAHAVFHRAVLSSKIPLPEATLVLKDEAHQQCGTMSRAMVFGSVNGHLVQEGWANKGVDVIGFTATPLLKARMYAKLIEFGSYSEMRREGMHLPIRTFSPSEIDTKGLSPNADGEYSEKALESRVMKIYGDVFQHYHLLNPSHSPTILFAPSVASSRWFANKFHDDGVTVAHIDGESCLVSKGGKLEPYASTKENRDMILEMSRTGQVKVLTNRFVLREAIDMPWLKHGIFATVMGSLTTYLQSVGRLQRSYPGYSEKILQDHGGAIWRHGSPNEDRDWRLGLTNKAATKERIERTERGEIDECIRCPKCGMWRKRGPVCINAECRHAHTQSVRAIRMVSGRLKQVIGQVYVKATQDDHAASLWRQQLYIGSSKGLTVGQCVAIFYSRCRNKCVSVDQTKLRDPPPDRSSPKWDLLVKDVYPWTVRKKAAT